MLETSFLDSAVMSTARSASLLNPEELRERRSSAPASTVKLPVCEEFITSMRECLVGSRVWDGVGMGYIMLYTGVMFGYEFAARVGEFTEAEGSNTDLCGRTDDLSFSVEAPGGYLRVEGSALANLIPAEAGEGFKYVSEGSVRGVTTKGKITVKS
jgi:hypothetical protein